jgi:excisionase family DNA binding protein
MSDQQAGLSVELAARALGVSTPTVRRWIKDGALPAGWRAERFGRGGERTYFLLWGPPEADASVAPDDASATTSTSVTEAEQELHIPAHDDGLYERALALARDLTRTSRALLAEATEQAGRRDALLVAQERVLGALEERSRLNELRIAALLEDRTTTAEALAQARDQLDATRSALQQALVAAGEARAQLQGAVARADAAVAARDASQSGEHVRSLLLRSQRGWRRWLLRWVLGAEALSILQVLR